MSRSRCLVAGLGLLFLASSPASAAPAKAANAAIPKNDPFVTKLKTVFDASDLDSNGELDTTELAKAFRGPKAKAAPEGMYDDNGKLSKTYYAARTKYPELILLWSADTDGDGLLSWPEYRNYEQKLLAAQQAQQPQQVRQPNRVASNRRTTTTTRRSTTNRNYHGNTRTTVRRSGNSRNSRNSNNGYQAAMNRAYHSQQAQMARAMANWQNNEQQARANYLRAYEAAVRQRQQQQQQILLYLERQRAAAIRLAQEHWAAIARNARRRR